MKLENFEINANPWGKMLTCMELYHRHVRQHLCALWTQQRQNFALFSLQVLFPSMRPCRSDRIKCCRPPIALDALAIEGHAFSRTICNRGEHGPYFSSEPGLTKLKGCLSSPVRSDGRNTIEESVGAASWTDEASKTSRCLSVAVH